MSTSSNEDPVAPLEYKEETTLPYESSAQVPAEEPAFTAHPAQAHAANHNSIGSTSRWLQLYLCAAILCNFGLLFLDGNGGDIGYWKDWIRQLSTSGYENFNGNYPPLYIHWLYVAGKFYNFLQIPIENNIFLKYLSQVPVLLSHLLLICLVANVVAKHAKSLVHFHTAMLLTTFNPAILFNGPIWGQIDVIPLIPVIAALMAGVSDSRKVLMAPLYTIALLTKFQMIAFAPVFGILFFRNYKIHLMGAILCIPTIAIAFLPSIFTNSFVQSFKLAYIDVLHQYGATTMGAANIWILLTGNAAPDSIVLFGIDPQSILAKLFTAKNFGIVTFTIVCICVFVKGMWKWVLQKHAQSTENLSNDIFFYAMICTVAFFTLLPAMHERYLLPAAIIALMYYAFSPSKIIYPLAFAFISAFNLAMCLGIKTSSVWPSLSWIMLIAFFYGFLELLFSSSWLKLVSASAERISAIRHLSIWVLLIGLCGMTYFLYEKTRIHPPKLLENQYLLTTFTPHFTTQDYGSLRTNLSINGNVLSIGGIRYANGFGTHANSTIDFILPPNTKSLSFMAGLDNEVESADVRFSVWGDDKILWQSPVLYGAEKNIETVILDLTDIKHISLKVSSVNGLSSDHADWINPIITISDN